MKFSNRKWDLPDDFRYDRTSGKRMTLPNSVMTFPPFHLALLSTIPPPATAFDPFQICIQFHLYAAKIAVQPGARSQDRRFTGVLAKIKFRQLFSRWNSRCTYQFPWRLTLFPRRSSRKKRLEVRGQRVQEFEQVDRGQRGKTGQLGYYHKSYYLIILMTPKWHHL